MKKFVALLLAALMVVAMFAACTETTAPETTEPVVDEPVVEEGDTLTIYVWNEEFKGFFEKYYWTDEKKAEFPGVEVEFIINTDQNGVYQSVLDAALQNGETIDIFLAEADYITKYVRSPYSMDVADLGITAEDLEGCYDYTVQVGTDAQGVVKAVSFQCCPGAFVYRIDMAEKYLGITDDAAMQEAVKDWDAYVATAATFAEAAKGEAYFVAGLGDVWYAYKAGRTAAWVDNEWNLGLNDYILGYLDIAKALQESGAIAENGGYGQWGTEWSAAMAAPAGNVFSFLSCTWHLPFCMATAAGAEEGYWRAVEGPVGYFWGGTWLLAANTCDNPTLTADVLYSWSCDADFLEAWAKDSGNFANNQERMEKLAADDSITDPFLCGQNYYAVFAPGAQTIEMKYLSNYDRTVEDLYKAYAQSYATGELEKDEAVAAFVADVQTSLPTVVYNG